MSKVQDVIEQETKKETTEVFEEIVEQVEGSDALEKHLTNYIKQKEAQRAQDEKLCSIREIGHRFNISYEMARKIINDNARKETDPNKRYVVKVGKRYYIKYGDFKKLISDY